MEEYTLNRIVAIAVVFCAISVTPALGYWEYLGTTTQVDEPVYESDPEGTYSYLAWAYGYVDSTITSLYATGQAYGEGYVGLETWDGSDLERAVWVYSGMYGSSTYVWRPDETSKALTVRIRVSVDDSDIEYAGSAVNRSGTVPANSASGAEIEGGGGLSYVGYDYPYGFGHGAANSEGGTYAMNDEDGLSPTYDYADFDQLPISGWYEGEFHLAGSTDSSYNATPWATNISASTTVDGSGFALGHLKITDPELIMGGFEAEASYFVRANSRVDLSGNIDDRE
jgi:hypothetical protein